MGKRGPKPLSAEELAKRGSWRAGRRALEEAAAASGATGPVSAAHDAAAPPEPKETAPAAPLPEGDDLDAWLPLLLLLPKWDPRAQAKGFRFDGEKARHVIEWFEAHVRHLTGSKRGELVRLEPFQRSFLANLFGWVHDGGPRDGLRRFTKALLYIGGKNGKALDVDTPIPTPDGWKRMSDLVAGDVVFDERGVPCRVVAAGPTQTGRPCYRVAFDDGASIVADAEHEWYTDAERTGRPGPRRGVPREQTKQTHADHIRTTEQIRSTLRYGHGAREANNHSIPVAAPLRGRARRLPIQPYTLGAWLGDGTSTTAQLTCAKVDFAILDRIRADGYEVGEPKFWKPSSPDTATVTLTPGMRGKRGTSVLRNALRAAGLLGNKHIPAAYLRASIEQRTALLHGLMDTDGYVSRAGQCEFTTTSPALRDGIVELLRSLGYKPNVKEARATVGGRDVGAKWRVAFFAYADRPCFHLPRKAARLKPAPTYRARSTRRQVVAVDPVESRPVRCIQVDSPSRLYLAGPGMVPTHNSTLLGGLAAYAFTELAEGGAKVLTAATSRPQARTVWEIARDTICADQPTLAKCVVRHADIRLVSDQAAVLKPISGEVKGEDGAECFFAILDELHRQNDTELLDVLEKGGSTRDEAVLVILTTADEIRESPCNNELAYAKAVRDNPGDEQRAGFNPSYLPAVYELDDGDDWTKEENWHKANPGLGTIKSLEFMRGLAREAKERRDKRPGFQRLHLNLRVQSIAAAIRWPKWEGCAGPDDWLALRAKMAGRPCILGGDLAETNDMVALIAWFYEDSVVVPFYWACKAAAEERFRKNEPVYFRWRDAGALDLVDHDAIELAPVVERIEWCTKTYRVMDVGVDAAKAQELIFAARVYGLDPIRVEQGWKTMTEPCDKLTQLVENGRVRHGRHPVLDWNVVNLRWKLYGASAKKPVKPSESQKIDGCSAWLTALAVALRKPPKPPSVYETRGVRVL